MSEEIQEEKKMSDLKAQILSHNSVSMNIRRVPVNTSNAIKKLAQEEFCGDYGMTLKYLLDTHEKELFYKDEFLKLRTELEVLKEQFFMMLSKEEPSTIPKKIKTISGRTLNRGNNE